MCIACIEYTKDKLNVNEFSFALREMTQEDKEHFDEVSRILKDFAAQPDEIKKRIKALSHVD